MVPVSVISTFLGIFPCVGPMGLVLLGVRLCFCFSRFCHPEDGSEMVRESFLENAPDSWKNWMSGFQSASMKRLDEPSWVVNVWCGLLKFDFGNFVVLA